MADMNPDKLRTVLRAVLEEHRTDAASLSREIGRSKDYIRDFLEGRKTTLPLQALVKIEQAFSLETGSLLKEEFKNVSQDALVQIASAVSGDEIKPRFELEIPKYELRRERIPVFSYRDALDGTLFVSKHVHYTLPKPHIVETSLDAYGILIEGNIMSPAFDPGDIAIVNPNISFRVDADAVFFGSLGDRTLPDNEFQRAAIRRLTGYDNESWLVAELSPFKSALLPRRDWPRLSRIVGKFSRP